MRYRFLLSFVVFIVTISSLSGEAPSRILIQKLACSAPNQILDYVTNTGVTTSANYTVRADILETPGEEIGTDLGTPVSSIRIYKVGNGTSVPYYAAVLVQQSQFSTAWAAGSTMRLTVTYLPTGETSTPWDISIPTGSGTITILDPVMIVPPQPITELEPPVVGISINGSIVNLSWDAVPDASTYNIQSSSDADGVYTHIASTSNTSYNLAVAGSHAFYKVTAASGRVESVPSEVVGYIKYECVAGNNLIAMPLEQAITTTSELGALYDGAIDMICLWDTSNQQWEPSVNFGGFWDPELTIGTGSVLLIQANSPLAFYSAGTLPSSNPQYSIVVGDNTVVVPLDSSTLSTSALVGASIGDGESVNTIHLWNPSYQQWDASVNYGVGFWDPEFVTTVGMPLFLNSGAIVTWPDDFTRSLESRREEQ